MLVEHARPALQGVSLPIAWLYLLTNSARVLSYVPQILALRRWGEDTRAMSLVTWCYWLLSHVTAVLYGIFVLGDGFFVTVSVLNLAGCGTVTCMLARRRGVPGLAFAAGRSHPRSAGDAPVATVAAARE
jgi:hypothetical protein